MSDSRWTGAHEPPGCCACTTLWSRYLQHARYTRRNQRGNSLTRCVCQTCTPACPPRSDGQTVGLGQEHNAVSRCKVQDLSKRQDSTSHCCTVHCPTCSTNDGSCSGGGGGCFFRRSSISNHGMSGAASCLSPDMLPNASGGHCAFSRQTKGRSMFSKSLPPSSLNLVPTPCLLLFRTDCHENHRFARHAPFALSPSERHFFHK